MSVDVINSVTGVLVTFYRLDNEP